MKTVVITGSTRGIGYGAADQLLARGCQVMISGRSPATVAEAVNVLAKQHGGERVAGQACDVTDYAQVQALWDAAARRFNNIDIWINNAGQGNLLAPLWEQDPTTMRSVVDTNVLGTLYGCKVAITGMLKQGYGHLYNIEGFGSRGGATVTGLTLYGTSKAGLSFLDKSLAAELKNKPVKVSSILPGMVLTDLLLNQRSGDPEEWERSKWIYNILADKVETIAPWIADQVLAEHKNGAHIAWLTGGKVMLRFLTARFHRRHIIDE